MKRTHRAADKPYRFRRLFFALMLSISLLSIVIILTTAVTNTRYIVSHTTQERVATYRAYQNTIADDTDYLIGSLQGVAVDLSKRSTFVNLCFLDSIDRNSRTKALYELADEAASSPLIDRIFAYYPNHQGVVLTSQHTYSTLEMSEYAPLIQSYDAKVLPRTLIRYNSKFCKLFLYEGQLVIATDFILNDENRLATMFLLIRPDSMFSQITGENQSLFPLYLYDSAGQPVFQGQVDYGDVEEGLLDQLSRAEDHYLSEGAKVWFYQRSTETGLQFLFALDASELTPPFWQVFASSLPTYGVLLVIIAVVAYILARYIIQPVDLLIDRIGSTRQIETNETLPKNEIEYLNYAFAEIAHSREEISTLMQNVNRDVMTRLFQEMLSGKQIDYASVVDILNNVHSEFEPMGSYVTFVTLLPSGADETRSNMAAFNRLDAFFLENQPKYGYQHHALMMSDGTVPTILCFDKDMPILSIKQDLLSIERELRIAMRMELSIGYGHIYHSILDTGLSYKEALERIHERAQAPAQDAEVLPEEVDESVVPQHVRYSNRSHQIVALAAETDENAIVLAKRIMEDLYREYESPADLHAAYTEFYTVLSSEIAKLKNVNLDTMSDELLAFDAGGARLSEGADELLSGAQDKAQQIIDTLIQCVRRSRNPYILAAQEEINRAYSDGNISLNSVAEHVGVTPSYLSKLFKTGLNVNFTDYLNECRVRHSAQALLESDAPVKDIALSNGFNSVQSYIRVFKKYMTVTPSQYRADGRAPQA